MTDREAENLRTYLDGLQRIYIEYQTLRATHPIPSPLWDTYNRFVTLLESHLDDTQWLADHPEVTDFTPESGEGKYSE